MTKNLPTTIARYAAALAAVLAITYFYQHTHRFNATTIAFTYLLAILGVSAVWGLGISVFMSLSATLAYNYFFLPPVGTLTIADPQNWVALFTFLATSILASDLSSRARNQAAEANRRRHEVERLYKFSQRLLSAGSSHPRTEVPAVGFVRAPIFPREFVRRREATKRVVWCQIFTNRPHAPSRRFRESPGARADR